MFDKLEDILVRLEEILNELNEPRKFRFCRIWQDLTE